MKFGKKLRKKSRGLAVLVSLMMCLSVISPIRTNAASENDKYAGGTGITDILTYFQYFVDDDAMIGNHTVGPVAIGGKLTGGKVENDVLVSAGVTFGDGAHTPSYAKEVYVGAIGSSAGYGGTCRDFYYGSISDPYGFQNELQVQNFKSKATLNPNYIDVDGMFASITSESEAMAKGAVEAPLNKDTGIIECDFTGDTNNYKISYENFKAAERVVFKYSSVDDIRNKKCVVSIVGVDDEDIFLSGEYKWPNRGSNNTMFSAIIDGQTYGDGSFLQKAYTDDIKENECNISGMKLIINMPDANKITTSAMGGHIVAPKADLTILQGRFEGGIIAKSVSNPGAEAHYFPYNSPDFVAGKGTFSKKALTATGEELPGATIEISYVGDGDLTEVVREDGGDKYKATSNKISWESTATPVSLSSMPDGVYTMKETGAPEGYKYASEIVFKVEAGKIYEKTGKKNGEDVFSDKEALCIVMVDEAEEKTTEATTTEEEKTEATTTEEKTEATTTEEKTEATTTEEKTEATTTEEKTEATTTEEKTEATTTEEKTETTTTEEKTETTTTEEKTEATTTEEKTEATTTEEKTEVTTTEEKTEVTTTEEKTTAATTTEEKTTAATTTEEKTTAATTTEEKTTQATTTEEKTTQVTTETAADVVDLTIVVIDEKTGDRVPGAVVKAIGENNMEYTGTTDKEGTVIIPNLPAGNYSVEIVEVPKGYTVTTKKKVDCSITLGTHGRVEFRIDKSSDDKTTSSNSNTNTNTNTDSVVKTGDNTNVTLLFVCMILSIAGLVLLILGNKKFSAREHK